MYSFPNLALKKNQVGGRTRERRGLVAMVIRKDGPVEEWPLNPKLELEKQHIPRRDVRGRVWPAAGTVSTVALG